MSNNTDNGLIIAGLVLTIISMAVVAGNAYYNINHFDISTTFAILGWIFFSAATATGLAAVVVLLGFIRHRYI